MNAPTVWLSCGVLHDELEESHRRGELGGKLMFLDSMLHMVPQRLEVVLREAPEQSAPANGRLVLVYGDCCGRMLDLVREFRVGRVSAINCAQMLVGRARYRELMKQEAFLLLPEWARRLKEGMQFELGLSAEVARDLMRDHRRELVYLDTGLCPVPEAALNECAAYSGLPWRVEKVDLTHLLARLREAEATAAIRPPREEPS